MSGAEGFAPGLRYPAQSEQYKNDPTELTRSGERRARRPGLLRRIGALATVAALAHGVHVYQDDVRQEKERLSHTHAYVSEYSPTPTSDSEPASLPHNVYETMTPLEQSFAKNLLLASHTAIVDMPGFGKTRNDRSEGFMGGLGELGAGWTLNYDPNGLDFDGIAQMLVDRAHDDPRGINRLAFYGDSMGTIVATKIAAKVAKLAPDIAIPFIIYDSPAVCLDVLRDQSRNDGFALINAMRIPGAEYSRILRVAGEMYLQRQKVFDDPTSLPDVYGTVHHTVFDNEYLSANVLLKQQFQTIDTSDVGGDLKYLGGLEPDRRPDIFMIGAADPRRDDVVDTPKAYRYLKKWTGEADLPFHRLSGIEDFRHGDQGYSKKSRQEYTSIFSKEVVPVILRAEGALDASSIN